ncbi:MAG TPA: hypothetical protein VLD83_03805, partial [Candidatus Binatia bacterium]|nr:hypothetical protein [Candidatus Binatia bacterium]
GERLSRTPLKLPHRWFDGRPPVGHTFFVSFALFRVKSLRSLLRRSDAPLARDPSAPAIAAHEKMAATRLLNSGDWDRKMPVVKELYSCQG